MTKTPKEPKIKPCPFCGGEALMMRFRGSSNRNSRLLQCRQCQVSYGWVATPEEAAALWNKRTNDV